MGIPLGTLERAARTMNVPLSVSVASTKMVRRRSAFLCHSHRDKELVKGLVAMLSQAGFTAYVDWEDMELPSRPDRSTAEKIQSVIKMADVFLFLATPNSVASRWCPWEIGYADGVQPRSCILIVPTLGSTGEEFGSEYLSLYRRIDTDYSGALKFYEPDESSPRSIASL